MAKDWQTMLFITSEGKFNGYVKFSMLKVVINMGGAT